MSFRVKCFCFMEKTISFSTRVNKTRSLEAFKNEALKLMRKANFPISEDILVALDPNLEFMGYTAESAGRPLIVVSGMALNSGLVLGLLVHELSHVYRTETRHPSHNFNLQDKIISQTLDGRKTLLSYQEEIIHNIINNVQDLYADDISMTVFEKFSNLNIFPRENMNRFFLGWINNPIDDYSEEGRWVNAGFLLSAAFAQANLIRHHIPDTGGIIEEAVREFLALSEKNLAGKYPYFKNLYTNLPEKITDEEFAKLLSAYLEEFIKLINSS